MTAPNYAAPVRRGNRYLGILVALLVGIGIGLAIAPSSPPAPAVPSLGPPVTPVPAPVPAAPIPASPPAQPASPTSPAPEPREATEEQEHALARSIAPTRPLMRLRSWRWNRSAGGGYAEVVGEVENLIAQPLPDIEVEVRWYAADGSLVTVESSHIERDPLLPGEVSSFSVMEHMSAAMASAKVGFKRGGTSIPTEGANF